MSSHLGDSLPYRTPLQVTLNSDFPNPPSTNETLFEQDTFELQNIPNPPKGDTASTPSSREHTRPSSPLADPSAFPETSHLLEEEQQESSTRTSTDSTNEHMSRRARNRAADQPSSSNATDGHANGDMNHTFPRQHRRKMSGIDTNNLSPVGQLLSRSSFALDDEDAGRLPIPKENDTAIGFFDLPIRDRRNFLMLVMLYFLQGIPMGLATGSVPFLLKAHLSYGQIGVFSLAAYPYSLKLLWSPIVDAVWTPKLGRRKSWILPIQTLSGIGMIWLGGRVRNMMIAAGANGGAGVWTFTWWWFFLVFMCATQDIAVDGWALTCLGQDYLSYASTAQTVGLTGGQFLSYTVFLALNAPDFANRWFRQQPLDEGLITLGGYLKFWGYMYLIVTVGLAILKKEEKTRDRDGIMDVYKVMGGILKLKNVQSIIVIHLIAKIGFQANDAVTNLKLLDKGFSQEDLALTVLIDFPFELALGYYAGKWSSYYPPLHLWCWAFIGRLIAACFAQFVVMIFPSDGVKTWYLLTVIVEHIFSTFMSTIQFVASAAFHAKIADPVIGGTYMTMLATVSNLGGTFPRFFVLKLVDMFTVATCAPPSLAPNPADLKEGVSPVTSPFSCVQEVDKHRCIDGGGTCSISTDGYYIVNMLCVVIGVVTFFGYIKPKAMSLQALPLRAWRLAGVETSH